MADEADLADKDAGEFLERALAAHRNREVEVSIMLKGVKICVECGSGIEGPRAAIPFAVRCIYCQIELEKSESRYPKG